MELLVLGHSYLSILTLYVMAESLVYAKTSDQCCKIVKTESIDVKLNFMRLDVTIPTNSNKNKCMETRIGKLTQSNHAFGLGNNTSKRAESKEAYLNENIKNVVNQPIYGYILEKCKTHITNQHVYDILHKVQDIYSVAASLVQEVQEKNGVQLVYSFAFQKNAHTLYHWNNDNHTWEKMNQKHLQLLFDAVQKAIIGQYNNLIMNEDENEDFEVENSIYIFKTILIKAQIVP